MNYYYNLPYSNYDMQHFFSAYGAIVSILAIILVVFGIVTGWRILTKAGDKGWKILIPIYGTYCMFKAANSVGIFWGFLALSIVSSLVMTLMAGVPTLAAILSVVVGIVTFIMSFIYCKNMATAFGKGTGFAVGLFLLPIIFLPILAFGSAEYMTGSGYSRIPGTTSTWRCANCGTENSSARSSCEKCGQYR